MRLKAPDFDALFQRLRYRFRLEGLNLEETTQYISRRLIAAGLSPNIFSDDSSEFIFHLSEGLPRRINNICSLALLKAKTTKRSKVDLDLLKEMDELD
jgi:type II secretory pathway predicted ATPase ExeA